MPSPRYEFVDTPDGFERAARALAGGRGPFAIDTERASAYRYDDRAFLVQIFRRDAGIFLFAPEGHRQELTAAVAPVVNGRDWIVHAAPEDLPSLAELGMFPGSLFDTALAGRIGGFDRPNLAAMVEEFCGTVLEKGHGQEDWSAAPLPDAWLAYAADDVAYLNDLAEAQAEFLDAAGKLDIAEAEFAHIVEEHAHWEPAAKTWRDLKGISRLASRKSLAVAEAVWEARDAKARQGDMSPALVLPHKVVLEMAKELPRTPGELAALSGFPRRRRGAVDEWFEVLQTAYASDSARWPERPRRQTDDASPPGKSAWQRHHPESWEAVQAMRSAVAATAAELEIQPEVVLSPAVLREAVWAVTTQPGPWSTHRAAVLLTSLGARPWQVAATAPLFGSLFGDSM